MASLSGLTVVVQNVTTAEMARRRIELPTEIWNRVIDLVDDFITLKACALTCKTFLSHSRFHLYKRPYVKNFHNAKLLVRAVQKDPACRHFIRELLLDYPSATTPTGPVVKHLFPHLPCLQAISICGFVSYHPYFYSSLPLVAHTVTSLRLYHCQFDDFIQLGNILLALPLLENLALHNVSVVDADLAKCHSDAELQRIGVTTLDFADGYTDEHTRPLGRWLSKTSTPNTLRQMYLIPMCYGASAIQDFVALIARNPCSLVLNLTWLFEPLVIPRSAAIRSLKLSAPCAYIYSCLGMLQGLASDILHDLCLSFTDILERHPSDTSPACSGIDCSPLSRIAWLDSVLAPPQFKSLRRFSVQYAFYRGSQAFTPSSQDCRDHILKNWLPSIDPRLWTDFGDFFHVEPPRLSRCQGVTARSPYLA